LDVEVQQHGPVPEGEAEHARTLIGKLMDHTNTPVLYTRVRLTMINDPARLRPALAQVNIDLNGRLVRAHAAAPSMHEAIELMGSRLSIRVGRIARDWESTRGRHTSSPGDSVRRTTLERARTQHADGPEEPQIIRHKAYTLGKLTVADAVREMELLDYDFHLFTEARTGADAVVHRAGCGYRLLLSVPMKEYLGVPSASIAISGQDPTIMTSAEAIENLELSGAAFVFFIDRQSLHGCVLYHRHDGNLGLITSTGAEET